MTDNEIAVLISLNNWGPGPGNSAAAIKFLDTAIAICRAESGGNPNAVSNTGDYGLWQINKAAHPQYFPPKAQGGYIWDPLSNTYVAKTIYAAAGGWSPWSTYKNGSYKAHLG
ncbi:MAG TPA: transglycosylase SLT domain-containing protein, partial [Nitrospira sp.]|nr:transglycosylase SLT domain-containing protein [Nitrospira sp.]